MFIKRDDFTRENLEKMFQSCSGRDRKHCKNSPSLFPAPSRDVTYQILSSREYVSLMKPEVFPDISFPGPEFSESFWIS